MTFKENNDSKIKIFANLKMHVVDQLIDDYAKYMPNQSIGVFVPYPYLAYARNLFDDTKLFVGAQNISAHSDGAYTGQVSAKIVLDVGVQTVLIGHSEVRRLGLDIEAIYQQAAENNMNIVYCVGEDLAAYESNQREAVLKEQLKGISALDSITIAYEPIWSIGTGRVASNDDINQSVKVIQDTMAEKSTGNIEAFDILYGGSVNNNNCLDILNGTNVNGFLIGGAALSIDNMLEVMKLCK